MNDFCDECCNLREDIRHLRKNLEEAKKKQISGFYENDIPTFRQGEPEHELEELVTAEEVNGHVKRIVALLRENAELRRNQK